MERRLVRNCLAVGAALLLPFIVVAIGINDPLVAIARLVWRAQPWKYACGLSILASRGLVALFCSLLSLTQIIAWVLTSLGLHHHALCMGAVVLVSQAVCCLHQSHAVATHGLKVTHKHTQDIPIHKGKKRWGHRRRIHWYCTYTIE